jgi:hypothetical protein
MLLFSTISLQIQEARKNGDKNLMKTLQDIKVELDKISTAKNAKEITEEVEISVIKKMYNECIENANTFLSAGRNDLYQEEKNEADILKTFLPNEASEEDIISVIRELSKNTMVINKKEMGNYIKEIKAQLKNVDGKLVADTVKKYILS